MHRSLPALVGDLKGRVATVLGEIDRCNLAPAGRLSDLRTVATYVGNEADALLAAADLSEEASAPARFREFFAANDALVLREQFELPFITNWAAASERATSLCERLTEDIGWPWAAPDVGTFSVEGFWAYPNFEVICLPAGGEGRLLALPDLVHELGHIAMDKAPGMFVGDLFNPIKDAINRVPDALVPAGWDPDEFRDETFYAWQEGWLEEFICDLIATFCMGSSFAWQHIRLWAITADQASSTAVSLGAVHPPDDARMSAVQSVLNRLGHGEAPLDGSHASWVSVTKSSSTPEEQALHAALFPGTLLDAVAAQVLTACADLGLLPFDPSEARSGVPGLVTNAWISALTGPGAYGSWEERRVAELWEELEQ